MSITTTNTTPQAPSTGRTVPFPHTLESIKGYPDKLKIYMMRASSYWQARYFDGVKMHKRSSRTSDKREAIEFAKAMYRQIIAGSFTSASTANQASFEYWSRQMLESQQGRVDRDEFTEESHRNDQYMLDAKILPDLRSRNIKDVSFELLDQFVVKLSGEKLDPSTIQRYLGIVLKVLQYAANRGAIAALPHFPKIKMQDKPRAWFNLTEYRKLYARAKALIGTEHVIASPNGSGRKNETRKIRITADLPNMIVFMVNGFIRPTDLKNMQHKHVAIVRDEHTYLRLTLPESKKHSKPVATMQRAVDVYERQCKLYEPEGLAKPEDYVFMPQYANRDTALKRLQQQFNFLLEDLCMKTDVRGNERTIYSLRHTCIMFRLLNADGMDMLTLARNARTSVEMIERFYASELTGEMNIDIIQSQRKTKRKLVVRDSASDNDGADQSKVTGTAKTTSARLPVVPGSGSEPLNLPTGPAPTLSLS
ncbi:hypothetical protein J2801_002497 [Paraburkholderia phenoliruptrix]|uniref:hypothetical protein n=1 Tax=Paraburkholderia phenoliruptrix TaxID=252970 RepID=UPI002856B7CE|nr:hypothetical protein [Paraburkholderia phenoliruptrix]MDR6420246.1 hypothetical protein [Paraburkholderia phenoliruptrix]